MTKRQNVYAIDPVAQGLTDSDDVLLITRAEAARRMSLSVDEIDEARFRGDLGAVRYGRKVLISVTELRRFAENLPADEP